MTQKTILIVGTYDTKSDELAFLERVIKEQGGDVYRMDVSVLGTTSLTVDIEKEDVAAAMSSSIEEIIALKDENLAFQKMASGAALLTQKLYKDGKIDAMIALGGTMGTDLALDCAAALPMGVPKYIVSTIAFSPLIPVERISPDIQMILWAGGLYGLNSLCQLSLAQAAGAVLGAARAVKKRQKTKPLIGMTSLGKSTMRYMTYLNPALEERGFEVTTFHATGLGGRVYESLALEGAFACVMDFCLQEFINGINGSPVHSGQDRLINAGKAGIPQMVAPGASDIIDFLAWADPPPLLQGRAHHAHNRLIDSVFATVEERVKMVDELLIKLSQATGKVHFFLPLKGVEEWDRKGNPAYNPEGLAAFNQAVQDKIAPHIPTSIIDAHICDPEFSEEVLIKFDEWCKAGIVKEK